MFSGFTDETFEFFMAIRFNNNREFFQSNHDWYVRAVRQPALDLAEALADTVEKLDPDLERRPNKVVSRINRDIRFSLDKSPYRDYIWLAFRRPGEERATTLGTFVDFSFDGASYGMGFYDENKPMMNALRRQIRLDAKPFLEIWDSVKEEFALFPKQIKRMAIPDDIPEGAKIWYNMKGFYIQKQIKDFNLLKSPAFADEVASGFMRMKPLRDYIANLSPEEEI